MGRRQLKEAFEKVKENQKVTIFIKNIKIDLYSLPFNYGTMIDVVINKKDNTISEFSNIKNMGISKYKIISNRRMINKIFKQI